LFVYLIHISLGERVIIYKISTDNMSEMFFKLDRDSYKPKETLSGSLILKYEKAVDVKSLEIYLKGYEEAIVGSGVSMRKSRNEFLCECLEVYRNEKIEKGEYEIRFEFDLPADLLASYMGYNNSIVYSLQALADVPYPNPKETVCNFGIQPVEKTSARRTQPMLFSFKKQKPYPEFQGSLNKQSYYAGEEIIGEFTIFNRYNQNIREVTLIIMSEDSVTYQDETMSIPHIESYPRYKDIMKIPGNKINFGYPHNFQFKIPTNACSTFSGKHSSHKWYFYIDLDVALLTDVYVKKEIEIFNPAQKFAMSVVEEGDK